MDYYNLLFNKFLAQSHAYWLMNDFYLGWYCVIGFTTLAFDVKANTIML